MLYKDVTTHITTVCSNRLVNCPYCTQNIKYNELESIHFKICTKYVVSCPNEGCTTKIERGALKMHCSSCEYEPVLCKYSHIGCPARIVRKNKEVHEDDHQLHLELALETISAMKSEKSDSEMTCPDISNTHHPLTQCTLRHPTSNHLKEVPQKVRYGTVTTFKMSNFEWQKSTDSIFCSPPFYSNPGGYKLCVKVYANGKAAGHTSHISVVVHIMRGENDNNLSWPFMGEITLEILNQDEDRYHHTKILKFPCKLCSENAQTITGECNTNGYGYQKFIPHHALYNVRPTYIINDELFFRVSAYATQNNLTKPWLT